MDQTGVIPMKKNLFTLVKSLTQWKCKDLMISVPSNDISFSYIVKYSGGGCSSDHLPMLIGLHGDFDSIENFYETVLNTLNVPARIIVIKGPIPHSHSSVWPFLASQLEKFGPALSEAVDLLTVKYSTKSKPVLLGFSGGGVMAYYQAVKHGYSYSYIFPISALLSKEQLGKGSYKSDVKVYAYHGKSDEVVPFSAGKKAVKLLKRKKVNITFTEFDSGHQGPFTDMKAEITKAVEEKLVSL